MNFDEALKEISATDSTLTAEEKRQLNEDGYVVFRDVYDESMLTQLRDGFDAIVAKERGDLQGKESGTRHPKDLLNHDPVFVDACLHSRILAAVHHVLARPFRLTQCSGRDPLPGFGQQGLHADWMPRQSHEPFVVATAICMLDAFAEGNGQTRIVAGTHLRRDAVPKAYSNPASNHPDELLITGEAGSVLVFNGHLWHSGTRNDSTRSRRALQCVFHAAEIIPPFAQPLHAHLDSLSPAIRIFLAA